MQKHTFHRDKTGQFSKLAKTLSYQQETLSTLITAPFSLQNIGQQIQKKQANYSREIRKTLVHELKKQYLEYLQILLDKTPEEEQYEYEIEQQKYYNKLYKILMASMVDNTSEQERKRIRNEKEQVRRDYKKFLLILIDD